MVLGLAGSVVMMLAAAVGLYLRRHPITDPYEEEQ